MTKFCGENTAVLGFLCIIGYFSAAFSLAGMAFGGWRLHYYAHALLDMGVSKHGVSRVGGHKTLLGTERTSHKWTCFTPALRSLSLLTSANLPGT